MAKVYRSPSNSRNKHRRKRYCNEIPNLRSFAPPDKKTIKESSTKTKKK